MSNVIAKFAGGIHSLVQAAIRTDGAIFMRYQHKGLRGYQWGAWRQYGSIDPANIPASIDHGFSTLRPVDTYRDFSARLPKAV